MIHCQTSIHSFTHKCSSSSGSKSVTTEKWERIVERVMDWSGLAQGVKTDIDCMHSPISFSRSDAEPKMHIPEHNQPNQVRILTPFWRQFQTKRQNEMVDSEVPRKMWRQKCRRLKRFRIGITGCIVCCYSGCRIKSNHHSQQIHL